MGEEATPTDDACAGCEKLRQEVAELKQQVAALLARLNKNSSNSSRPPSSDAPWQPRPAKPPTGRKPGGQPGHEGAFRQRLPAERINQIVHHLPTHCGHCNCALPPDAPHKGEPAWHQVAELPPLAAVVAEHQAHALPCAHCGFSTRAEIPMEVRAHTAGPRLSAALSYLSGRCHQSRRLVAEIVETVFQVPIALGSICAREQEMSAALEPAYNQIAQSVRAAQKRR